jgi:hypothetical protein
MQCGDACVDLKSDPVNCGACGHDCGGGGCLTDLASGRALCQPFAIFKSAGRIEPGLSIDGTRIYFQREDDYALGITKDARTVVTPEFSYSLGAGVLKVMVGVGQGSLFWFTRSSSAPLLLFSQCNVADCYNTTLTAGSDISNPQLAGVDGVGQRVCWFFRDPSSLEVNLLCSPVSSLDASIVWTSDSSGPDFGLQGSDWSPPQAAAFGGGVFWVQSTPSAVTGYDHTVLYRQAATSGGPTILSNYIRLAYGLDGVGSVLVLPTTGGVGVASMPPSGVSSGATHVYLVGATASPDTPPTDVNLLEPTRVMLLDGATAYWISDSGVLRKCTATSTESCMASLFRSRTRSPVRHP